MLPFSDGREASTGIGAPPYVRHRPERTFLYQLVEEYHPAFKAHLAAQGTDLPGYVEQEFEDYLKCGRLEHGFLRVRCDSCHAEHLVAFSCKRRGLLRASCPAPCALRPSGQPSAVQNRFVEPLDFIARLAVLAPKPRVNLTRFHGVFAPNSKYRPRVTPSRRSKGGQGVTTEDLDEPIPAERRAAMTWAQRLKRVFGIDIESCPACGGAVRIIACIEGPDVIEKILTHLARKAPEPEATRPPPCRVPPQRGLFDETG